MNWNEAIDAIQLAKAIRVNTANTENNDSLSDIRALALSLKTEIDDTEQTIARFTQELGEPHDEGLPMFIEGLHEALTIKLETYRGYQELLKATAPPININQTIGAILADPELKVESLFVDPNLLNRMLTQAPEILDFLYDKLEQESKTNEKLLPQMIFSIMLLGEHLKEKQAQLLTLTFTLLMLSPDTQIQKLLLPIDRGFALLPAVMLNAQNPKTLLQKVKLLFQDKAEAITPILENIALVYQQKMKQAGIKISELKIYHEQLKLVHQILDVKKPVLSATIAQYDALIKQLESPPKYNTGNLNTYSHTSNYYISEKEMPVQRSGASNRITFADFRI